MSDNGGRDKKLRSMHAEVDMLQNVGRPISYCVLWECGRDTPLTKVLRLALVRKASESLRSSIIVFLYCSGFIVGESVSLTANNEDNMIQIQNSWDDRWILTIQSAIAIMNIMGGKVQMTAKRASPTENGVTGGIIDG